MFRKQYIFFFLALYFASSACLSAHPISQDNTLAADGQAGFSSSEGVNKSLLFDIAAVLESFVPCSDDKDSTSHILLREVREFLANKMPSNEDAVLLQYAQARYCLLIGEYDKAYNMLMKIAENANFSELDTVYHQLAMLEFRNNRIHQTESFLLESVNASERFSREPLHVVVLSLAIIHYKQGKLDTESFESLWKSETKYSYVKEYIDFTQLMEIINEKSSLPVSKPATLYSMSYFGILYPRDILSCDWISKLTILADKGNLYASALIERALRDEEMHQLILRRLLSSVEKEVYTSPESPFQNIN